MLAKSSHWIVPHAASRRRRTSRITQRGPFRALTSSKNFSNPRGFKICTCSFMSCEGGAGVGSQPPPTSTKVLFQVLLQLSRTPCRNLNSSTRDIHMCMRVCGHTQKDVHTCIRAHMAGCQNKGSWLPEKGWRYQGLIGQNQGSPTKTFYIDNYADTYILVGTRMPYMYIWLYVCNLILYLDVYI